MSNSRSTPDGGEERAQNVSDDSLVAELLRGSAGPAMRPEFASALAARLDTEFAKRRPQDRGRVEPARRVAMSRVRAWVGVAAVALVALAIGSWAARPAYSWESMLEALEEQTWWQASEKPSTPTARQSWASPRRRVLALRSDEQATFVDARARSQVTYDIGSGRVSIDAIPDSSEESAAARLLLALQIVDDPETAATAAIVSQNWRRVRAANGEEAIELVVVVAAANGRWRLTFQLDPETSLPESCQVEELGTQQDQPREVALSYPSRGPESIYELGLPARAEAVESAPQMAGVRGAAPVTADPLVRVDGAGGGGSGPPPIDHMPTEPQVVGRDIYEVRPPAASDADPAVASPTPLVASNRSIDPPNRREAAPPPELDQLLDESELIAEVDRLLADHWRQHALTPVAGASDGEFMRRAYLDLTGRIPTVSEAIEFYESGDPDRRQQLISRLLDSRDHATHLAALWRGILFPVDAELPQFGGTRAFDEWFAQQVAANRPYDDIVRELLTAEGRLQGSGPLLFYAAARLNPEELAARTSRAFLGTRMECAQCHDHPFDEVSQQDFWGMAAYFARISRPDGKMEMTSPVLQVRDTDHGEVTLPDTDQVVAPRIPGKISGVGPEPAGAPRRRQLAEWITASHNQQFARATVNRAWAILFGRGLVDPVDDMRPDNQPVSPQVLDLLARQFASSGFDLQSLFRVLVSLEAYELSSAAAMDDPARRIHFAQMNLKSFTAEQLYDCIAVATRRQETIAPRGDLALLRAGNGGRDAFIEQFSAPGGETTDYQAGIPQALTLMHGQLIQSSTQLASSGLLKSLAAPFFSDSQRIDTLFLATLSRPPTDQERAAAAVLVEAASNEVQREQALGDILWALLNSAEFTFNH